MPAAGMLFPGSQTRDKRVLPERKVPAQVLQDCAAVGDLYAASVQAPDPDHTPFII